MKSFLRAFHKKNIFKASKTQQNQINIIFILKKIYHQHPHNPKTSQYQKKIQLSNLKLDTDCHSTRVSDAAHVRSIAREHTRSRADVPTIVQIQYRNTNTIVWGVWSRPPVGITTGISTRRNFRGRPLSGVSGFIGPHSPGPPLCALRYGFARSKLAIIWFLIVCGVSLGCVLFVWCPVWDCRVEV